MFVTHAYYDELFNKISDAKSRLEFVRAEQAHAYNNCGDGWHDNPYYTDLISQEKIIVKQIDDLSHQLANAKITDCAQTDKCVSVQTIVTVDELNHTTGATRTRTIKIVPIGATTAPDTIPYNSPYGAALIGAEVGEIIDIKIPAGELEVTIIDIKKMLE